MIVSLHASNIFTSSGGYVQYYFRSISFKSLSKMSDNFATKFPVSFLLSVGVCFFLLERTGIGLNRRVCNTNIYLHVNNFLTRTYMWQTQRGCRGKPKFLLGSSRGVYDLVSFFGSCGKIYTLYTRAMI